MSVETPDEQTPLDIAVALTQFREHILYVVADYDEPPHGLAIKADLEAIYHAEVNHGRLYPNLDQLVDDGLLEKGALDRRTNYYELTDLARRVLAAKHDWEATKLHGVQVP
ncbi:PadR family transcriptional regulator [Haladaptatus sp. ZSTT2]|uniref:PadR family transcriptional regulator n=1 Tax=Haladaptatus sp. ZSTT2 TaxID=3120515 RepID=UPI00300F2D34